MGKNIIIRCDYIKGFPLSPRVSIEDATGRRFVVKFTGAGQVAKIKCKLPIKLVIGRIFKKEYLIVKDAKIRNKNIGLTIKINKQ